MNITRLKGTNGYRYKACFGSRLQRTVKTFDSRAAAENWLIEEREKQNRSDGTSEPILITFKDLFLRFQEEYAKHEQAQSTQLRESQIVRTHLVPYFGEKLVTDWRKDDIQRYINSERGRLSPATISKHFQLIHKVLKWGVENCFLPSNPAVGVKCPKVKDTVYRSDFKFFERDELLKVLPRFQDHYPKAYPLVYMAVTTGMRLGELCGARMSDLIMLNGMPVLMVKRTFVRELKIFKDSPKSGYSRVVPINDDLLVLLKPSLENKQPKDLLLFESEQEAITCYSMIRKMWARVLKSCGVEYKSFHTLRHSYATHFLSSGGNAFALQRMLGHSSIKVTDKYSHVSEALIKATRNVVKFDVNFPQCTPNVHQIRKV